MADRPRTSSSDPAASRAREQNNRPEPIEAELGVVPNNVDAHDLGAEDKPEVAWGEPASEAYHGETHTRRPEKTEAERGQGRKTVERNKDIVKGGLYDRR